MFWPLSELSLGALLGVALAYALALLALTLLGHVLRTTLLKAPLRPISGSHVVITGGSEGIGFALGLEAARQGARVTIMARSVGKLDKAVEQLNAQQAHLMLSKKASKIVAISCDVTDATAVTAAIAKAELIAPIDFLICGAGAAYPGYFLDQDTDVFERTMRLNYLGSVFTAKAAAPAMVARGSGHIILVSSGAAAASFLGYSSYAPTKFAVRGFGDAIRNELIGTGVRVSVAYPPDTDTPGFEQENKTKPAETSKISPPEVHSAAAVAKLLLSSASVGVYHLPSPDPVQNLLIDSIAGITPTDGSTALLAFGLSPLATVAARLFGVWADYVAGGYGVKLNGGAAARATTTKEE